ncbi:MAG: hypothetical protein AB1644_09250 [Candidatus Zixiibacteriota bacterium]
MASKLRALCVIVAALVIMGASTAQGQIIYGQPAAAGTRLTLTHWEIKSDTFKTEVDQYSFPVTSFVPLGENFEAQLYLASASSDLSVAGNDYKLTGIGDVRAQVSHSFSDDHLLISGGISLPTGKKKLTFDEEWNVLQLLTQNFLSFPVRRLGEGFGFNGLVGGATMLGSVRAGAGLMYQFNGKYTPYEGADKYDPGDWISVNGGLDGGSGSWLWTGNLIFTLYTADKYKGSKSFKQGTQTELQFGVRTEKAESYAASLDLGYLLRGRNTRYQADETISEQLRLLGNEFNAGFSVMKYLGPNWFAGPSLDIRFVGEDERPADEGLGSSNILGIGGAFGRKLGKGLFDIGFTYYTGSADGGDMDITGYQLYTDLKLAL